MEGLQRWTYSLLKRVPSSLSICARRSNLHKLWDTLYMQSSNFIVLEKRQGDFWVKAEKYFLSQMLLFFFVFSFWFVVDTLRQNFFLLRVPLFIDSIGFVSSIFWQKSWFPWLSRILFPPCIPQLLITIVDLANPIWDV